MFTCIDYRRLRAVAQDLRVVDASLAKIPRSHVGGIDDQLMLDGIRACVCRAVRDVCDLVAGSERSCERMEVCS